MSKINKSNGTNSGIRKRKHNTKVENDYKRIQYNAVEGKIRHKLRTALDLKEAPNIHKHNIKSKKYHVLIARKKIVRAGLKRKRENKHLKEDIFSLYKGFEERGENGTVDIHSTDTIDPIESAKNVADKLYTASIVLDTSTSALETVSNLSKKSKEIRKEPNKISPNKIYLRQASQNSNNNKQKPTGTKPHINRNAPKVKNTDKSKYSKSTGSSVGGSAPRSVKGYAMFKNSGSLLKSKAKQKILATAEELPSNISASAGSSGEISYGTILKNLDENKMIVPVKNMVKAVGTLVFAPKKHAGVMLSAVSESVPDEFSGMLKTGSKAIKTGKTTAKTTAKVGKIAYKGTKATVKLTVKAVQIILKTIIALVKGLISFVVAFWIPALIAVAVTTIIYALFSIFGVTPNSTEENLIEYARLIRQLDAELNARINNEIDLADSVIYLHDDNTRLHTNIPTFFALFAVYYEQDFANKHDEIREFHARTYNLRFEYETFMGEIEIEPEEEDEDSDPEFETVEKIRVIIDLVIYSFDEMFEILEFDNDQISQARSRREIPLYSLFPNLGQSVNFGGANNLSREELERILNSLPQIEGSRGDIVDVATSFLSQNVVYQWGEKGHGTDLINRPTGLDCSGYVGWVFRFASVASDLFGTGTAFQWDKSYRIRENELLPGDLGFLKMPGQASSSSPNHVGIYLGTDSQGRHLWIHCASGTSTNPSGGVVVDNFNFMHFRRVLVRWND